MLGLRALVVVACFALHSAAVDPDALLRAFRRLGFRSALTAALATRLVPVLARDARRLHDAQRCRAGEPAPRRAVVRAVAAGRARPRGRRRGDARGPRLRRGAQAAARPAAVVAPRPRVRRERRRAGRGRGLAPVTFSAYPTFEAPVDGGVLATCAALALCALLPFADRRGIAP